MPDSNRMVIICDATGGVSVGYRRTERTYGFKENKVMSGWVFALDNYRWVFDGESCSPVYDVVAWMPMPDAYKED